MLCLTGSPPPTAARGTDEQDVALFHDNIPQVGDGDDPIRSLTIPGIDEALMVLGSAGASRRLAMF